MTLTEQEPAQPLRQNHRVHAILVTHDGARWLPEVVRSLQALTRKPDSLIAVDTESRDASRELVAPLKPITVRADRADGFGDAVALGSEHLPPVIEGVVDWVWLLHDDFAPTPDCLEVLIRAVDDAPSVAVAGPKLRGWHDRSHLLEIGVSIAGNGSRWTDLERRERDQGQHDGVREVLAVSTAGMLVRRDVWEELEGLDPNLELFRDDVDFGWRAIVAGHQVRCITDAMGFHAEAAATERRTLDVRGLLRRPHLLDRRNGAYVLLANCSTPRIPIVFLRLVFATALRSVGYLFAKLPGYALDEVGGLLLFIARPDLLREARRARKARRLLSARTVRPFLAPFGSQTRAAIEGLRELLLRGWNRAVTPRTSYTVVTEGDDDFFIEEEPLLRRLLVRPGVSLFLSLSLLALFAGRQRLGSIAGGALLPSNLGASDLFKLYTETWHQVGLGSAQPAPLWVPTIATLSLLVGGNVSTLITLILLLALPLSAMSMYIFLRRRVSQHWFAAVGAFIYALSAPVLTAITSGRLAGIVMALLFPLLLHVVTTFQQSWRRTWVAGLLLAIMVGFTPILMPLGLVVALAWLYFHRDQWQRIGAVFAAAFLMNSPWSFAALIHPSRWLAEPGLTLGGGSPLSLLALNPGGIGAPPLWIASVAVVAALILVTLTQNRHAIVALATLAVAQLIAVAHVQLHNSGDRVHIYVGTLLVVVVGLIVVAAVSSSEGLLSDLSRVNVGLRHIAIASVLLFSLIASLSSALWFAVAQSPVKGGRTQILPPFVAELSRTQEQKRTLVLDVSSSQTHFGVLRGNELHLGDSDVAREEPQAFNDAVSTLLAGSDEQTIDQLNRYNIGFILMLDPIDQEVARTLDSVGGLTRLSVSDGKILWKVGGAHGLVRLIKPDKSVASLVQEGDDLRFSVPSAGLIQLSERAAPGWRAVASGKRLDSVPTKDGMQAFAIPAADNVVISYDSPAHRAGIALGVFTALGLLILIAPGGRRLSEQSDEEVA